MLLVPRRRICNKRLPSLSPLLTLFMYQLRISDRYIYPLSVKSRSIFFVESNGGFIPLQYLPNHPAIAPRMSKFPGRIKKQLTQAFAAHVFSNNDIFEV